MIDKSKFYKEATQRLTSTTDIGKAIEAFYQYMSSVMPLDALIHTEYSRRERSLLIRTLRTDSEVQRPNATISLSEKVKLFYEKTFDRNAIILNSLQQYDLGRPFISYIKKQLSPQLGSAILLRYNINNNLAIGYTGFYANGSDRYTQEHIELIEMLAETMCLVNTLSVSYFSQEIRALELADENRFLSNELKQQQTHKIIGAESGLKNIVYAVRQISKVDAPVLILGETGVGKELIADAIQESSERSGAPYIKINCGAIPDSLIDSELFGFEKGAFTGAGTSQKGRFERANGGTIFLDEIGELSLAAQVRLLRVLQNKEIERVGGKSTISVDIRVIAATHRNLSEMVASGEFREDLLFRLNVFPITVPPLRHRSEDIPELIRFLVEKLAKKMNLPKSPTIRTGAITRLMNYSWPGNVRELENLVERELILHPSGPLEFNGLQGVPDQPRNKNVHSGQIETLEEMIKQHILYALDLAEGKISGPASAAEMLKLNPNTLRSKMAKLGIKQNQNNKNRH